MPPELTDLAGFAGAELTSCVLLRTAVPRDDAGSAVNGFSVLQFTATLEQEVGQFRFLTTGLQNLGNGDYRLLVARSYLSVAEAFALTSFDQAFCDPHAPNGPRPVKCSGTWVGPYFVGTDEHPVRDCLPYVGYSLWVKERCQGSDILETELGPAALRDLVTSVQQHLGVDLGRCADRIGNFLVVWPSSNMQTTWRLSHDGRRLGIELRRFFDQPGRKLMVKSYSNEAIVHTAVLTPSASSLVVDLPCETDRVELEIYNEQGQILHRDAGFPLRMIAGTGNLVTTSVDISVVFTDEKGRPQGQPEHARTQWGTAHHFVAGGRTGWEEKSRRAKLRADQRALAANGRLFVYSGTPDERARAIADLRNIIHAHTVEYLKVWDPYFNARDTVRFLPHVFDPATPIKVLTTSLNAPDDAEAPLPDPIVTVLRSVRALVNRLFRSPRPSRARRKRNAIDRVLHLLREPEQGVRGLTNVRFRFGTRVFHDRFLITRDRAWQLGCSFNQIGAVISTIVEFPDPSLIEEQFDRAWDACQAAEELP